MSRSAIGPTEHGQSEVPVDILVRRSASSRGSKDCGVKLNPRFCILINASTKMEAKSSTSELSENATEITLESWRKSHALLA